MDRFHIIEDGAAVLRSKGVYRQSKVYRRGAAVYAAWSGGFIRLLRGSATTHPNVSWDGVDADGVEWAGPAYEPQYRGG